MTTTFKSERCNGHSMVGVLRKVMVCAPGRAPVAKQVAASAISACV